MKMNQFPVNSGKGSKASPVPHKKVKDSINELQSLVDRLETVVREIPSEMPLFVSEEDRKSIEAHGNLMETLPEKVKIAVVEGMKEGTDIYIKKFHRLVKGYCLAIAVAAFILGFAVCMSLMR